MSELPKGWDTTTFGSICGTGQYGWTTKASSQGDVKYLRTTDITKGQIEWDSVPYCQEVPADLDKYQIQENDILISRAGSVGFSALIDQAPFLTVFASYLIRFVPLEKIEPYYVAYFLRSPEYWKQISEASAGIALANVNAKKLAELSVPIPPLNEQRRIVAKLDRLFARSRCAREELGRVSGLVQRYKQAILAAAFRGDLTADWREENQANKNVNTEVINTERDEKGWLNLKAEDVCSVQCGSTPKGKPFTEKGDVPYLKVYNIVDQKINFDYRPQFIPHEVHQRELKRCITLPGDVLMNIVGPPLGKVAIVTNQFTEWNINQALVFFRTKDMITKEYLYYFLREGRFVRKVEHETKGSVGQINISLTQCRNCVIPIPSLEEQKEIVRRVEKLFKAIDFIEQEHQQASKLLDRLEQATLSKAFRGELVPQDPNDEPAAVLLERIQSDRQGQPKGKAIKSKQSHR